MLTIDNDRISINKGDSGKIIFSLLENDKPRNFVAGDIVKFAVYDKNSLEKEPKLFKEIQVEEEKEEIEIEILPTDTDFVENASKLYKYWYQIEYDKNVIIGYDKNGAKEFVIYPEGK